MGKPLFKAPDGGYYEIIRGTKESIQSGLQQWTETFVLIVCFSASAMQILLIAIPRLLWYNSTLPEPNHAERR